MTSTDIEHQLADLERTRLRSLVEVRLADAEALHAPDFELVTPSGSVLSRDDYLGGIASGRITYRRFEAVSDIDVMVDGDLAVLRYESHIDIAITGQEPGPLECWHTDSYRRDGPDSPWQVRWSQATEIRQRI